MKPCFTIFLLFICAYTFQAQDPYHPMLADGRSWDIFQTPPEMAICPYTAAYHAFIGGDTVLGGQTYRQILRNPILAAEPFFCSGFYIDTAVLIPPFRFLREDSAARKVYAWSEEYPPEYVLFDYTLEAGDTLHYPWGADWPVNEVSAVVLANGEVRKQFRSGFFLENAYVEGLGSLMGAFSPMFIPFEGWEVTTCVQDVDEPLYEFDLGCITPGSMDAATPFIRTGRITLAPNPFPDFLRLEIFPVPAVPVLFELYDPGGRAVFRQEIPAGAGQAELAVPGLPPGLYFWAVNGHRGGKVVRE